MLRADDMRDPSRQVIRTGAGRGHPVLDACVVVARLPAQRCPGGILGGEIQGLLCCENQAVREYRVQHQEKNGKDNGKLNGIRAALHVSFSSSTIIHRLSTT